MQHGEILKTNWLVFNCYFYMIVCRKDFQKELFKFLGFIILIKSYHTYVEKSFLVKIRELQKHAVMYTKTTFSQFTAREKMAKANNEMPSGHLSENHSL